MLKTRRILKRGYAFYFFMRVSNLLTMKSSGKQIKIFKSFAEEEEAKWEQMARRSVSERMEIMFQLQRMAFPDAFDPLTGKRKPLEHRIVITKSSR